MKAELKPDDGARLTKLAALHLNEEDFASAEAAAMLAVTANPSCAEAWIALAISRAKLNEHAASAQAYLKALELRPQDVACWTGLGEVYLTLMQHQRAAAAFRQAMQLDPNGDHPAGRRARAVAAKTMARLRKEGA